MTPRSVTRVDATYLVTTPMFCGGANPERRAELRLPSFKGALRFWWRALAWRRLGGDLAAVRKNEAELFGSSDGGQSRVLMGMKGPRRSRIREIEKGAVLTVPGGGGPVGDGVRYLGYGLMEAFASRHKRTKAGELTRPCLETPFDFTVSMTCRDLRGGELVSLRNALIALGTLGGMGARSRKGFGSLALRSLRADGSPQWDPPRSPDELGTRIRALYRDGALVCPPSSLPPITAISARSRHLIVTGREVDALRLLDLLGREQVRYRSWGRNGRILGEMRSERNFREDHDLMGLPSLQRDTHPKRIAFGLPHNYGGGRDKQVGPAAPDLDRRASPLFIHIHECGGDAVAVVSFLPAEFLPQGKRRISVGGRKVSLADNETLYRPIHDYLDRLLDPKKRKEAITAKEVHP